MDRLWALKKEFDPFRWLIPGVTVFGILPIIRCTFYRCPYCRWAFKVTWGPSSSFLGAGERGCWHCKQAFWDGSLEWPEMSGKDRQLFLVPITVAGFLGALLVIGGLAAYPSIVEKASAHFQYGAFFLVFGLPLVLWFGLRISQIKRSIRRYNARGKERVA